MSLKQPVQYPVKYYSYLDTGAPQLADVDGNIKAILRAGLVTGIGVKEGAGWTALFEDDYRIILRRPLGTGNPPDIKIENGVVNGVASHRIVSQYNPTGLNDVTEIASVNLLARDNKHGVEWHLIASDFGFVFCYQMAENGATNVNRMHVMYIGGIQKIKDDTAGVFIATSHEKIGLNGKAVSYLRALLSSSNSNYKVLFANMQTGVISEEAAAYAVVGRDELYFNNDYVAQKPIINSEALAPFYCSICANYSSNRTQVISIDGRNMLRIINEYTGSTVYRSPALYIPLDYWEL